MHQVRGREWLLASVEHHMLGGIRFAVSGFYSPDVSESTRIIDPPFADSLRDELASLSFKSPIRLIVFHPTIMHPDMGVLPDRVTYKRADASLNLAITIPHSAWIDAYNVSRVGLYASALRREMDRVKDAQLCREDKARLLSAVENVRHSMAARLCNPVAD
jgi:hypothetical protein